MGKLLAQCHQSMPLESDLVSIRTQLQLQGSYLQPGGPLKENLCFGSKVFRRVH